MYGLFQASVPTCEGKKVRGCNFGHEPNDFRMRKKKKKNLRKKGTHQFLGSSGSRKASRMAHLAGNFCLRRPIFKSFQNT
jgi:hypothetical protein